MSPTTGLRWRNGLAAACLVFVGCAIYAASPFNQKQLDSYYGPPAIAFTGRQFLFSAALVYVAALAVFYARVEQVRVSKSLLVLRYLGELLRAPGRVLARGLSGEERLALLTTLLKGFFGPMMVVSLMDFCLGAWRNGHALLATGASITDGQFLFNRFGFWFLLQLILFVDVLVFTVGYLVELPSWRNEIRSVESTLIGWAAALACYPPFNLVTAAVLGSYKSEFPKFADPTVHLVMNLLLLALMGTYAAASVALGRKASNLTHRGIVARWPYSVVRHPAYVCKNLAWWIGSIPFIAQAFAVSGIEGLKAIASMVGWTSIYVLRAMTEEDHLRRVDGEYAAYARKVTRRFIPGVL